ncbi:hypothetical protein BJF79_42340 [Actinomadura sp. CNU-125]|nr:hypothetical protein BJF79_42340 [Actinomadura sp. CNU-125]
MADEREPGGRVVGEVGPGGDDVRGQVGDPPAALLRGPGGHPDGGVLGGGHRYHCPSDGCSRYQRAQAPNSHHVPSGSTSMRPPIECCRCCCAADGHHAAATIARVSRSASANGSCPRRELGGGALP